MTVQADYLSRVKRVQESIAGKEPDRVPVIPVMQGYPIYHGGGTIQECMDDFRKGEKYFDKFYTDFSPDLGWDPILLFPSELLSALGMNWLRWPGNGIEDPNSMFQFIEGEYMRAEEYDEAIFDITSFMMTKWIPRSFKNLGGFSKFNFRNSMWFGFLGSVSPFSSPEVKHSLAAALRAAEVIDEWFGYLGQYRQKMRDRFGIPLAYGGFAYAPFDMIGDSMRGTSGILCDMYDHPEKLLRLIDIATEFAIQDAIQQGKNADTPYIWFWLHKGLDEFMSDADYKKFYWPSLQRYIVALTDAGLTPVIYCEGRYNSRLEILREVPKHKVIYDFEFCDIAQAKKVLGDTACIAGNLPNYLLSYGTKQEVVEATKRLIDTCAPGGGFMLDTSCLVDDAKDENMYAFFETAAQFGKY